MLMNRVVKGKQSVAFNFTPTTDDRICPGILLFCTLQTNIYATVHIYIYV